MATNITNNSTGEQGYQVPGAVVPQGWQTNNPAVSPTTIAPPPTTTNASQLGTTPLTLQPAPTPSTTANGIGGAADSSLENHQTNLDQYLADKTAQDTAAKDSSSKNLTDIMGKILGVQTSQATEESNANIPGLSDNANQAFTALQASRKAQGDEIKALDSANLTDAGKAAASRDINHKYASEQADLSISLDVANRNLTSAQAMVDKKISLELQPLQTAYDFQKTFYEDNKDNLSKDEQNQLTQMINENKNQIDQKNAVGDVLKTAVANGVQLSPQDVKQISSMSNPNDAYSYLASKGISLQNPLDAEYKRSEIAKNNAAAAIDASSKTQQALEQQYRQILVKEVGSRSGTVGTEDAKVAQANHLASLLNQYYDPNSGNYNVPNAQYGELVLGLAGMLSKTGTPTDSQVQSITQATAKGDIAKAISYVTGSTPTGSTQAVIKNLADSISRQAQTAEDNREAGLKVLRGLAPTDLDPDRAAALEQNTLVPFSGINGVVKEGDTKDYQGTTYKLIKGVWTPQSK